MFIQGTKSIAYELWEQNNFNAPANIVAAAGNGSVILGLYNGFLELLANNQITHLPKIFAVQANNCNPIYRRYNNQDMEFKPKKTIAEGISLYKPNRVDAVINAIKNTGGNIISVSETEIISALKEITKKGFYIEPTSAVAYAGIKRLIAINTFSTNEEIIMMVSGNGLKASDTIESLL